MWLSRGAARTLTGVLGWALSLWPALARASEGDEARTVVVVFEARAEAVSQRLRQEIEALGFEVDLQPEASPATELEDLALRVHAIAAIRVKPLDAGGVEMSVLDRATGKTVHRSLARVTTADSAGEELIATRTVELFRASLMELNAAHPPRGEVPVSQPVAALVHDEQEVELRQRAGMLTVAAGPALLIMPNWRPSTQFWVEASWISQSGVGVGAAVLSPLSASRLSQTEGEVDVRATSYRLGLLWDFDASDAVISGRLGIGWSFVSLNVRGNASSAAYQGASNVSSSWAPWLSASARLRLSSHFALLAQLSQAVSLPRQTIRFAERNVGDFARPAYWLSLGPELSWP